MKNFRKFLAAGVAAIMVFSLAGCGGSKVVEETVNALQEVADEVEETTTLEGTWEGFIDNTQSYVDAFDNSNDYEISLYDYVPTMTDVFSITFNEDSTYSMEISTDVDRDAFREGVAQYYKDVLSEEELLEMFGTTDITEAISEYFTDEELDTFFGTYVYEGTYTQGEDGSITLVDDYDGTETTGTFDGSIITLDYFDAVEEIVLTKA